MTPGSSRSRPPARSSRGSTRSVSVSMSSSSNGTSTSSRATSACSSTGRGAVAGRWTSSRSSASPRRWPRSRRRWPAPAGPGPPGPGQARKGPEPAGLALERRHRAPARAPRARGRRAARRPSPEAIRWTTSEDGAVRGTRGPGEPRGGAPDGYPEGPGPLDRGRSSTSCAYRLRVCRGAVSIRSPFSSPGGLVTRFQRLAVATTTATFLLIAVGGLVRATDSGLGCPDWPRCFGKLTPPPNLHAWIEHSHRLVAAVVIVLVALTVVVAWTTSQSRAIRWASIGALAMVISQAVLGAIVVWAKLEAESVTLHLATALALVALLEFITFRSRWGPAGGPGRSRRFTRLAMAGAGLTYAQMLVGSTVTGHDAGLAYPAGVLVPNLGLSATQLQFAHRLLATIVGIVVISIYARARMTQRAHPTITRLAGYAAGLVLVQIVLGVANVADRLSALTVVPHLAVGSLLWGTMFALVLHADRFAGTAERDPAEPAPTAARTARESLTTYFQLTKPRIIELLLITP